MVDRKSKCLSPTLLHALCEECEDSAKRSMNKETLTGGGRGGVDQINPAALAEPVINDCWQESLFDFLFNKYNDSINKAGRMEATFGSIIDGRSPHNSNYYR